MWRHAKQADVAATLRWLDEALAREPAWLAAEPDTREGWARWIADRPRQRAAAFVTLQCALAGPGPLRLRRRQRVGEIDVTMLPEPYREQPARGVSLRPGRAGR